MSEFDLEAGGADGGRMIGVSCFIAAALKALTSDSGDGQRLVDGHVRV